MNKAVKTLSKRSDLIEILIILDEDEIHLMKNLPEDVSLMVRIGRETGKEMSMNVGVPQSDCLSPVLFIIYLTNAMQEKRTHKRRTCLCKFN